MNDISAVPAHLLREATEQKPKNAMGKEDFMLLLMTQLRHQDPIKPMDHHEFATQLAQFSQLEQLSNIGSGITNLRTGQGEEAKLQALGMIGKRVQAAGNEIHLISGQPVTLNPQVKEGIKLTSAVIFDSNGKMVREIDLSRRGVDEAIQWDGKNQEGETLPSGKYTFRAHGVGQNGKAQEIGTELSGRVTGVDFENNLPVLLVETATGTSRLDLAKVRQVNVTEEAAKAEANQSDKVKPAAKTPTAAKPTESQQAENESTPLSVDISDLMASFGGLP